MSGTALAANCSASHVASLGSIQCDTYSGLHISIPDAQDATDRWSVITTELTLLGCTPIIDGNSCIHVVGFMTNGAVDARWILTCFRSKTGSPHPGVASA